MKDLGLAKNAVKFSEEDRSGFVLVRADPEQVLQWPALLATSIRRCYLTDELMEQEAARTGRTRVDLVSAKLPDPGSTMSGDFGEILAFLYHGSAAKDPSLLGPKKWRLKQDRNKPAPHSDVVQFDVPYWPESSDKDCILCSEVKTKSTDGASAPITSAIADSEKDRISRLTKTLVWLRDRALFEDLGSVTLQHLERFINATDHPPATRRFHAVAVICSSLLEDELSDVPSTPPAHSSVVVITVPALKQSYEGAFAAARHSVLDDELPE